MSKIYGKRFKWGVVSPDCAIPDPFNSCFVVLDWGRIIPCNDGVKDDAAIAEYRTLLENYLLDGKCPIVILSDGTLPKYLAENGGWDKRETADAFLSYAEICFSALSDCAEQWVTFEELTSEFFVLSKNSGKFVLPQKPELQRFHNMLLAHGMTVKYFRSCEYFGKIGIGLSLANFIPATPTKQDKRACKLFDLLCNRWVPSMLDRGMYPYFASHSLLPFKDRPKSKKEDPEIIATVIDFVLVSFHGEIMVSEQKADEILRFRHTAIIDERSSMQHLIRKMYRKTKLPVYIWDRLFTRLSDSTQESSEVFSQLEALLLDWVDVRGYFISCKSLSEPSAHCTALTEYIEKQ